MRAKEGGRKRPIVPASVTPPPTWTSRGRWVAMTSRGRRRSEGTVGEGLDDKGDGAEMARDVRVIRGKVPSYLLWAPL
ncbi:hypothetical protein BV22DRAFT_848465 [Leucogyrophana mollusca]|uniref:Uncharacterized protein n=1 Tax=Leucogyrophana mollusca TaxID=85980 RepID=A0ACB8B2D3_9AGAM|nr:hypothetical protein BV22DRAFT_848465 [Leucogyrophana mollusca]